MPRAKSSQASPDELSFGEVVGVFGLKGELRVHLHNRSSSLLEAGAHVALISPSGERRTGHLRTRSGAKGRVLAVFQGCTTPEDAAALKGWEIAIPQSMLPALDDGEYYHRDILGSQVQDTEGTALGVVTEIWDTGPVDLWVVRTPDGEDAYVAVLEDRVLQVDPAAKRIVVQVGACASTS